MNRTQLAWPDFAIELASVLPTMASGDLLVLGYRDIRPVQLIFCEDLAAELAFLQVEATADEHLPPDRRIGAEGALRLADLGWRQPQPPEIDNWWSELRWPFSGRAALRLAQQIAETLVEVYRITEPSDLRCRMANVRDGRQVAMPALDQLPCL